MDQGPENKRPRLSAPSWTSGASHHGVSLPAPPVTSPAHHPPPPYQPSHPFTRPTEFGPPPPPPPPPPQAPQPPQHHVEDRRHHEPEPYPPMQDHRQQPPPPPPSPAHPPYQSYPHRDAALKRDPGEDSLPQLRRPHSTGNAQEGIHGVSHVPYPPQPHPDDRRHMSFDNGPPPGPGPVPPMYRHPSYPPPTPVPPPQPYDSPISYSAVPPGESFYPIAFSTTQKRKAQRASQACDSCRALKAKCDETKPCKSCKEKGVECKYRDPAPKQQDKFANDVIDSLNRIESTITAINSAIVGMDSRLTRLEGPRKGRQPYSPKYMKLETRPDEDDHRTYSHHPSPVPLTSEDAFTPSPEDGDLTVTHDSRMPDLSINVAEAQATIREMGIEEEMELEPGPPVTPGEASMPINHTTLAGLLLTWPSIAQLVRPLLDKENIKHPGEFPMRQELQRGLIRLYGRGEGHDRRHRDKEAAIDYGYVAENMDDMSDVAYSPSPGDVWGQTGGLSPPVQTEFKSSVLKVDGNLDFTTAIVLKYAESFKDNMMNMHPLLTPKEVDALVATFLRELPIPPNSGKPQRPVAPFAHSMVPESPAETGMKRKRSSPGPDSPETRSMTHKPWKPMRTIQNALVLLILALGKICLWRDRPLPDIGGDPELSSYDSPVVRNGYPSSPGQGSPPSHIGSQSSGLPSPRDQERAASGSRRPSFQGHPPTPMSKSSSSTRKNLEVIPGLEYFAVATDILGNQLGGNELRHVYAHLFAGLYYGQLGRVLESWKHIHQASTTMQVVLRPSIGRLHQLGTTGITTRRDNRLAFTFWSCLQLESDIVAELTLPHSGILTYEGLVPYPNMEVAEKSGFPEHVVASYSAQLYLRKHLNQIHKMLYSPQIHDLSLPKEQISFKSTMHQVDQLQKALSDMRWVPYMFQFKEHDMPAKDILSARLRAKYWGAEVITCRPFIKQIVNFNYHKGHDLQDPQTMAPGDFRSEYSMPQLGVEGRKLAHVPDSARYYVRRGIKALIESTRAFHGLDDPRFIITNVWGTAHAQWGNLLTLSAAFADPLIGPDVDRDTLRGLFRKTLDFFKVTAHPSSTLYTDLRILEGLEKALFQPDIEHIRTNLSFSSSSSGHGPSNPAPTSSSTVMLPPTSAAPDYPAVQQ